MSKEILITENLQDGKIMKGIGGFYYVRTGHGLVYECKARGVFRNKKLKPLVGDQVRIAVIDEEKLTANIETIYPRSSELIRPASANVDQAVIVFAMKKPEPNYILLDKYLVNMRQLELPVILCFNKTDLSSEEEIRKVTESYRDAVDLHFICIAKEEGLSEVRRLLHGKTSVLAGPSGVGKSSFLNYFCPQGGAETGSVSEKIGRGRNTTRHAELFYVEENTWLMDTPGFSSMDLFNLEDNELRYYYPEFSSYEGTCRFNGCVHVAEPDCSVKNAVKEGEISRMRYDSYCYLYNELHNRKKKY